MKSIKDTKEIEISQKDASRRRFIKKAVYTAPKVLILGSLMRPTNTKANFGNPPEGPSYIGPQ